MSICSVAIISCPQKLICSLVNMKTITATLWWLVYPIRIKMEGFLRVKSDPYMALPWVFGKPGCAPWYFYPFTSFSLFLITHFTSVRTTSSHFSIQPNRCQVFFSGKDKDSWKFTTLNPLGRLVFHSMVWKSTITVPVSIMNGDVPNLNLFGGGS